MSEILDRKTIKALGADARQDIMKLLTKRPHTASEIAKATGKHVTTITEHLTVLEKSDLVRKKDSTNKWVYYTLTDKGEHLFKPQFYSWVVVFSLSIVFIFVGFLRIFNNSSIASTMAEKSSDVLAQGAPSVAGVPITVPTDYTGYFLIVLGVIGIIYLVYRKYKK
ncbi:MAG TPA: winged helix-turn-helix domain-containing protein [archaeon]|nr:winged helix-turn-helix domain-containing protein [archaeon]